MTSAPDLVALINTYYNQEIFPVAASKRWARTDPQAVIPAVRWYSRLVGLDLADLLSLLFEDPSADHQVNLAALTWDSLLTHIAEQPRQLERTTGPWQLIFRQRESSHGIALPAQSSLQEIIRFLTQISNGDGRHLRYVDQTGPYVNIVMEQFH